METTYLICFLDNLRFTFILLMLLSIPLVGLFGVSWFIHADLDDEKDDTLKRCKKVFFVFLVIFVISIVGMTLIPTEFDMKHMIGFI